MTKELDEYPVIWLSPSCNPEREWCQDAVFDACPECEKPPVKYVLASTAEARIEALTAERDEARERAHYANGVAGLAMRHRDEAEREVERKDRALEEIRNQPDTLPGIGGRWIDWAKGRAALALSPVAETRKGEYPSREEVERLSKVYADATSYYVEFHRGLRSVSSDQIRKGIRAVLVALRVSDGSPAGVETLAAPPSDGRDWLTTPATCQVCNCPLNEQAQQLCQWKGCPLRTPAQPPSSDDSAAPSRELREDRVWRNALRFALQCLDSPNPAELIQASFDACQRGIEEATASPEDYCCSECGKSFYETPVPAPSGEVG